MLIATPFLGEAFRRYKTQLARVGGAPRVAMGIFQTPGVLRGLGAMTTLYALASS